MSQSHAAHHGRPPATIRPLFEELPGARRREHAHSLQAALAEGMVYELGIDSFFSASHAMRPAGEQHSHSFRVQATLVTGAIDANGMMVGFREVSDLLEGEARRYANRFLNDVEPFNLVQPTGENLAAVIYRNVEQALTRAILDGPALVAVTLWENPTSYVRVGPGPH